MSLSSSLPAEVLIHEIYTFLPISHLATSLQLLSTEIRSKLRESLLNGSYFMKRERREYLQEEWYGLSQEGLKRAALVRKGECIEELAENSGHFTQIFRKACKQNDENFALQSLWCAFMHENGVSFPRLFHDLFYIYVHKGTSPGYYTLSLPYRCALFAEIWPQLPWVCHEATLLPGFHDFCWMYSSLINQESFRGSCPSFFFEDERIVRQSIRDGSTLAYVGAPEHIRFNKEIAKMAVEVWPYVAAKFSPQMLNDADLMLLACRRGSAMLEYASEELRKNRDFVMRVVEAHPSSLEYAHESVQADREVALTAARKWGGVLRYVSDKLKADRELVLTCVRSSGGSLEYAHESLRADREIVYTAVQQSPWAMRHAAPQLKRDRQLALMAVSANGNQLEYIDPSLQTDKEVLTMALKHKVYYNYVLHNNREALHMLIEMRTELERSERAKKEELKERQRRRRRGDLS